MLHKERSTCCEQGNISIVWREANSFVGPAADGWTMISHVLAGTPEFVNVKICPFCLRKFDKHLSSESI